MTIDGRGAWQRLRSRLEIAAYRELRPVVREGRIRPRTAIAGLAVTVVFASAGGLVLDDAFSTDTLRVDARHYGALEGLNDDHGDGLAAVSAGNEWARQIDDRGNKLPDCGEDVVY